MKICKFCQTNFEKRYAESKKEFSKRKYCCRACADRAKIGRITSEDTKAKLRLLAMGRKNSEASKEKVRGANSYRWKGGKPKCIECGKTLASVYASKCIQCHKKNAIGENHPHWKGGITPLKTKIRNSQEMTNWRISVFTRDDYTCLVCGKRGCELQAHHIVPFAVDESLRFDINNGQTLCKQCHRAVHRGKNSLKNPNTKFMEVT